MYWRVTLLKTKQSVLRFCRISITEVSHGLTQDALTRFLFSAKILIGLSEGHKTCRSEVQVTGAPPLTFKTCRFESPPLVHSVLTTVDNLSGPHVFKPDQKLRTGNVGARSPVLCCLD